MGADVKIAFSDVGANLVLEASHNGTDWVSISTISSDIGEDTAGVKLFLVDLTNIFAPFFQTTL